MRRDMLCNTYGVSLCTSLCVSLCALCLAATPSALAQEASLASRPFAAVLQPFVDRHALAGAVVLVAGPERVLHCEAVGFADIAANRLIRTDALFWIASQSKPITASALMMLVDEGKLNLDDPVEKYLPEFKNQWMATEQDHDHLLLRKPKKPVTVRNLLSHTSGLPFSSAMEKPTLDTLPLKTAVQSYAMTPLQYEPGSKYQYSNAGINTAGRLIEVLSGLPYETFLETRLFKPLGMKDTTFWPTRRQQLRLAKSYRPNASRTGLEETTVTQLRYPLDDRSRGPMPAGGLFSTADDLARFCQMILNRGVFAGKRYLSESAVGEMTRKQTGEALQESYGLGWSTGGGSFSHGGAYATHMTIDPQRRLITLFLVQHAGFPADGGNSHTAFQKAAVERFGNAGR